MSRSGAWPIWSAHLQSARNSWRLDGKSRFAGAGTALVLGLAGWWLTLRLSALMAAWQRLDGPQWDARLWVLVLGTGALSAALTVLGTLQVGFEGDEPVLLMTLPIPPAVRLRSLYGVVLVGRLGHLLLLQVAVIGTALVLTDPVRALFWVPVTLLTMGVAAWVAVVGTCGVLTLKLTRPGWFWAALGALAAAMLGLLLALLRLGDSHSPNAAVGPAGSWAPAPGWAAAGLLVAWGLLLGPGAGMGGRIYRWAFWALQGHTRVRAPAGLPGARRVARLLARRPGLMGAFLYKGWVSQSRNLLFLVRLLALLASPAAFPAVYSRLAASGLSATLLLVGFALVVTQVTLNERATSAVAGEGERMSLYLVAPISPGQYLRARYALFALPIVGAALLVTFFLGRSIGLGAAEWLPGAAAVLLILLGNTGVLVWGGAWDVDLDATVDGPVEAFLQEEAPITPRRMLVFGGSLAFQAVAVWLLWLLPTGWGLAVLALWSGAALALFWRIGKGQFARLVRGT